MHSLKYTDQES